MSKKRPSRAKMCSWLAGEIIRVGKISPFNPADIEGLTSRAFEADRKLPHLASVAAELGWHADASLDAAWEEIQQYERKFNPGRGKGESTHAEPQPPRDRPFIAMMERPSNY